MNVTVNAGRSDVRELTADELCAVSGGKTDVIKAVGNTSWTEINPVPAVIIWMCGGID